MSAATRAHWLVGMIFAFVATNLVVLLYFERLVFDPNFDDLEQYLLLAGIVISCYMLVAFISKFMKTRYLLLMVFAILLASTITWLIITFNLPAEPWKGGCQSWACQIPGQVAISTLAVCTMGLLLELAGRIPGDKKTSLTLVAGSGAGALLIVLGLISYTGYYFTILANMALNACTAISVVLASGMLAKHPRTVDKRRAKANFSRFLRNFLATLAIAILGFSTLDSDDYSFELLIEIGIGWLSFQLLVAILRKATGREGVTIIAEGIVIILFAISIYGVSTIYYDLSTSFWPSGLPAPIIGIGLGYFWYRVCQAASGITVRNTKLALPLKKVSSLGGAKVMHAIYFILLFGFSITIIRFDSGDMGTYLYPLALVLSSIMLVSWLTHFWKNWSMVRDERGEKGK